MSSLSILRNHLTDGSRERPVLLDLFMPGTRPEGLIIFTHGFKGFKDWGHFNLLARMFCESGMAYLKYNGSHNGTTPEQPEDFADPEAFGHNNFSIELDDLGKVIDWAYSGATPFSEKLAGVPCYLLGHSRGGGISILKAAEDQRVKKLAVWASVNEFGKYWSREVMKKWKSEGVHYIVNTRTKQELPLYYQLYEDYHAHLDRLHIPTKVRQLTIPFLIVHGTEDEAVPFEDGKAMSHWNKRAKLIAIEGGGHTFGAKHPWIPDRLPEPALRAFRETLAFFSG